MSGNETTSVLAARDLASDIRSVASEHLRQLMQLCLPVSELLQRGDRRNHIIAVRARQAVTLSNMMQLLLQRQSSRVLRVTAVNHVAQGRHPLLGLPPQPDRADDLPVD